MISPLTPAVIIGLSALAFIGLWTIGHNWGDDFSAYIMQAISIVEGHTQEFVEQNAFTINQSSYRIGPVTYPWGFPILLAPVYAFFGINVTAFKVVGLVAHLCFLVVLWYGFRNRLDSKERILLLTLFAFNPNLLRFGDNVLSDLPFLFFSTLTIVLFCRDLSPKSKSKETLWLISLGLTITISFLLRTNGGLLLITYTGLVFFSVIASRYRRYGSSFVDVLQSYSTYKPMQRWAMLCVPILIFTSLSALIAYLLPDKQGSYLSHFQSLTPRFVVSNLIHYGHLFKNFFVQSSSTRVIGYFVYLITIPLLVVGVWKIWRESLAILLYAVLTLALFIVWPHRPGLRFIFPLLPFYIYFVIIGTRNLKLELSWCSITGRKLLAVISAMFIASTSIYLYKNFARSEVASGGPFATEAQQMFSFIRENTNTNDVVVFFKPRAMRLFTGRPSLVYSRIEDFVYRDFYVVDKNNASADLNDVLFKTYPSMVVYENPGFVVYRFLD